MKEQRRKNLPTNPFPVFRSYKWVGPGAKDYEVKQFKAGENTYLQEKESEHENNNKQ